MGILKKRGEKSVYKSAKPVWPELHQNVKWEDASSEDANSLIKEIEAAGDKLISEDAATYELKKALGLSPGDYWTKPELIQVIENRIDGWLKDDFASSSARINVYKELLLLAKQSERFTSAAGQSILASKVRVLANKYRHWFYHLGSDVNAETNEYDDGVGKNTVKASFHFEFKEWQKAFAKFYILTKDGLNGWCLVVSRHPYSSGYWLEQNPVPDENTRIFSTYASVAAYKKFVSVSVREHKADSILDYTFSYYHAKMPSPKKLPMLVLHPPEKQVKPERRLVPAKPAPAAPAKRKIILED